MEPRGKEGINYLKFYDLGGGWQKFYASNVVVYICQNSSSYSTKNSEFCFCILAYLIKE